MKQYILRIAVMAVLVAAAVGTLTAQSPAPAKPMIPLKVQVVISRYEGDKKVSSLPYTLSVTANAERVSLRMGAQVPVPNFAQPSQPNQVAMQSYTFLNVGTNIDSSATTTDDGRFRVFVGIEDTSVMERTGRGEVPTLRNFNIQNSMTLRDGQTAQFTSAADKTTGEVVKVDVTVTVEK